MAGRVFWGLGVKIIVEGLGVGGKGSSFVGMMDFLGVQTAESGATLGAERWGTARFEYFGVLGTIGACSIEYFPFFKGDLPQDFWIF